MLSFTHARMIAWYFRLNLLISDSTHDLRYEKTLIQVATYVHKSIYCEIKLSKKQVVSTYSRSRILQIPETGLSREAEKEREARN